MNDEDFTIDSANAGASETHPAQCSSLHKGDLVVIKGRPCKITATSTSKTGKHGHAKVNLVAEDLFIERKKYEEICPSTHNMDVPQVKRQEYQVTDIDDRDNFLNLMDGGGNVRVDIKVPEGPLGQKLTELFERDGSAYVSVLSAMGMSAVVTVREDSG